MNVGAALREAALKQPQRLQALKRNKTTRDAALRLEEHAHGRATHQKRGKKK